MLHYPFQTYYGKSFRKRGKKKLEQETDSPPVELDPQVQEKIMDNNRLISEQIKIGSESTKTSRKVSLPSLDGIDQLGIRDSFASPAHTDRNTQMDYGNFPSKTLPPLTSSARLKRESKSFQNTPEPSKFKIISKEFPKFQTVPKDQLSPEEVAKVEERLLVQAKLEEERIKLASKGIGQKRDVSHLFDSTKKMRTTLSTFKEMVPGSPSVKGFLQTPPNEIIDFEKKPRPFLSSRISFDRSPATKSSKETLGIGNHGFASIESTPESKTDRIQFKMIHPQESIRKRFLELNNAASDIPFIKSEFEAELPQFLSEMTDNYRDQFTGKDLQIEFHKSPKSSRLNIPQVWSSISYLNLNDPEKLKLIDEDNLLGELKHEIPSLMTGAQASRSEILALSQWINSNINSISQQSTGELEKYVKYDEIYNISITELLRQVSIDCVERSDLLFSIWSTYLKLFNKFKVYVMQENAAVKEKAQQEVDRMTAECQRLAQEKDDQMKDTIESNQKLKEELSILNAVHEKLMSKDWKHKQRIVQLKKICAQQRKLIEQIKEENEFYTQRYTLRAAISKRTEGAVNTSHSINTQSKNNYSQFKKKHQKKKNRNDDSNPDILLTSSESEESNDELIIEGENEARHIYKIDNLNNNNIVKYKGIDGEVITQDYQAFIETIPAETQTDIVLVHTKYDDITKEQKIIDDLLLELKLRKEVDILANIKPDENEPHIRPEDLSPSKILNSFKFDAIPTRSNNKNKTAIFQPKGISQRKLSEEPKESTKTNSKEGKGIKLIPISLIENQLESVPESPSPQLKKRASRSKSLLVTETSEPMVLEHFVALRKNYEKQESKEESKELSIITENKANVTDSNSDENNGSPISKDSLQQKDSFPSIVSPNKESPISNHFSSSPQKFGRSLTSVEGSSLEDYSPTILSQTDLGEENSVVEESPIREDQGDQDNNEQLETEQIMNDDTTDDTSGEGDQRQDFVKNLSMGTIAMLKVKLGQFKNQTLLKRTENSIADKAKLLQTARLYKVQVEKVKTLEGTIAELQEQYLGEKDKNQKLNEQVQELNRQIKSFENISRTCTHGKCPICEDINKKEQEAAIKEEEEEGEQESEIDEILDHEHEDDINTPTGTRKKKQRKANQGQSPELGKKKKVQIKNPALAIIAKLKTKKITKFKNFMATKNVLKLITTLYAERINFTKDNNAQKDEELCSFTYTYFLNNFGFKNIAEQKFIVFVLSVKKYLHIVRINLFARFMGLLEGSSNYNVDEFNKYIEGVESIFNSTLGSPIINNETDPKHFVPYLRCLEYIKNFSETKMSQQEYSDFKKEFEVLKQPDPKNINRVGIIDIDLFMTKILLKYRIICNRTKLNVINAFKAADLDGNQYCCLKEFRLIYRYIEPEKYDDNFVENIFYEHADVKLGDEVNMSLDKFTVACVEYGLFSDTQQDQFLGVTSQEELEEKIRLLRSTWIVQELEITKKIDKLTKTPQSDKIYWLDILKIIAETLNRPEEELVNLKPVIIAFKILEGEIERFIDFEVERDAYGVKKGQLT